MRINKYVVVTGTVCALAVAMQGFAQTDDADADEPVVDQAAEKTGKQNAAKEEKGFDLLVRVASMRGTAEVMNPDVGTFEPMVKSKAYPLGSVFRTGAGGSVRAIFSGSESVEMSENTEIVVLAGENNPKGRAVRLVSGHIKTELRANLQDGQFSVETANAGCRNMAGRAEFALAMEGENERFQVHVITGAVRMEGPQYTIGALRAANTVNVLTTPNRVLSHLTGVSGDYKITLDNETDSPVIYDMSPKAVVKIWRDIAPLGGNMVVSTLVVSPTGKARHSFAYVLGRGDIIEGNGDIEPDPETEVQALVQTEEKEKKPAQQAADQEDKADAEEEEQ